MPAMLLPIVLLASQAVAPGASSFVVDHQPVACVVSGKHPQMTAVAPAGADIGAARVYFRGDSAEWYSVSMKIDGTSLEGVLPAPTKKLREFHYYVEATSRDMRVARTPDVTARVVSSNAECKNGVVAAVTTVTSLLVQGPAGAAAVPAGFAPSGLVAAGVGGGISATTVVVAGAAVAGAGAVAATQLGGDNADSAGGTGNSRAASYSGPYSAEQTFNLPSGCRFVEQRTMNLTVEIPQGGSGRGQYFMDGNGRAVVSASNCSGVVTGTVGAFGINGGTFSASGSAVTFSETSNPSPTLTRSFSFQGTVSGNTIQGTATLTERASDNGVTATSTVSLTLTRR